MFYYFFSLIVSGHSNFKSSATIVLSSQDVLLFLHIFISSLLGSHEFGFVLVVSSGGFLLMGSKQLKIFIFYSQLLPYSFINCLRSHCNLYKAKALGLEHILVCLICLRGFLL